MSQTKVTENQLTHFNVKNKIPLQPESKREEFRKYLEGAGVLDALTKGLFT